MSLPLQVFILGLITVFLVLLVVVATGNTIIWFVNRFIGAVATPAAASRQTKAHPKQIAAITTAVHAFTQGKGRVSEISKLK